MKEIWVCSLLLLVSMFSLAQTATIKIDVDRPIGQIDPLIYSNFTEHLGHCVYQGIYDPSSPCSDQDGFRTDVLEGVNKLNVPLVRWPGGNFASGYHWEDGIGPKSERPVCIDLAWGAREDNSFGTDEFMKWCRKADVQSYLCVNLGTGTPEEAAHWVEYCNCPTGTKYADLRSKYGHPSPYHVTYWGLGNEVDGPWQIGHKNVADYSKIALETAKLMKWTDKNIRLIAAGSSNYGADWINWNRTVINTLADHADFISLHNYEGNTNDDYYAFMASTEFCDKVIRITEDLIEQAKIEGKLHHPMYIAFDEYNASYNSKGDNAAKNTFNMEDALVVAQFLNTFVRHADVVKMANMAQLVNLLGPMMTTKDGIWYQTIFFPLELFANHCFGISLSPTVLSPTFRANGLEHPDLDVSASYDPSKKVMVINVVNRCKDKAITTCIIDQSNIWGRSAAASTVNGDSPKSMNSLDRQEVKVVEQSLKIKGHELIYHFEPHSFTQVRISTH
ncbi:MAG: alpha-N-arabinofuranosidase [Prevotella sp.]|jgi:alpha-N-arabinofuranosidase|nr:alpha-N-arabinofuranosidase [Prevotella sp.]